MGYIYKYWCSNCDKIKGEVAYGFGMLENNIDTRLFGCENCGEVFSGNINDENIHCPNCNQNAHELELEHLEGKGFRDTINSTSTCPNCKYGNIQLKPIAFWD